MSIEPEDIRLMARYPLQEGEDNVILRTKCQEIKTITPDIRTFAQDLLELMRLYKGVWLAAPQVGKTMRMAAVTQRDTSKKDWQLQEEWIILNPVVVSASDDLLIDTEACLSLPGMQWPVARPAAITLKYMGMDGKIHFHKATGYNARIILHELDHLDGVLFIDKLAGPLEERE
jgi:peptide deformylase